MFNNILVAIDGSATAEKGLQQAIALCKNQGGAKLTVLHVLDLYSAASQVQMAAVAVYEQHLEAARRCAARLLDSAVSAAAAGGVQAKSILREVGVSRIADEVVWDAQKGYDLIVLGTHGRRGFRRFFLGSEAELVVRSATAPVLLIRADETDATEKSS